jgi:hypothetical protein
MKAHEYSTPIDHETVQDWREFTARPLQTVHLARLRACFEDLDIPAATLDAILVQPRLRERLTRMLENRFALQPLAVIPPPEPVDVPVATLSAPKLSDLTSRCGVVFWAEAFVREIRAPAVRALREHFGGPLVELALAQRSLACPLPAHGMPESLEALSAAVERDGQACVNAWLAEQPRALAAWQRLKISESAAAAPISAAIAHYGPAIVRQLVRLGQAKDEGPEHAR